MIVIDIDQSTKYLDFGGNIEKILMNENIPVSHTIEISIEISADDKKGMKLLEKFIENNFEKVKDECKWKIKDQK